MILIIGATGFIGSALFHSFLKRNVEVVGTYSPVDNKEMAEGKLFLDLSNEFIAPDTLKTIHEAKYIILCHGISSIDLCLRQREIAYLINVKNTIRLLSQLDPRTVPVYFSSNMVYDGDTISPKESEKTKPITEYGRQKAEVEQYIQSTFSQYIILRATKVFGVKKGDKTLFTSWMESFIQGVSIKTAHDLFISPVFVDDVVDIIVSLIQSENKGVYNVGGLQVLSIYEFANLFAQYMSYDTTLIKKVSWHSFHFADNRNRYNGSDSGKVLKAANKQLTQFSECFERMKLIYLGYSNNSI